MLRRDPMSTRSWRVGPRLGSCPLVFAALLQCQTAGRPTWPGQPRKGAQQTARLHDRALEKDGKIHADITENMFGIYVTYGRGYILSGHVFTKSLCAGLWYECLLHIGTQWVPRGRRRMFTGIVPYPTGCCFVLLLSVDNVQRSRTSPVQGQTWWPTAPRCGTPTPFATILPGRVHDSVPLTFVVSEYVSCRILRYRPPTSGVSLYAPATMLGLRFKQDNCIVSPQSVCSYVK